MIYMQLNLFNQLWYFELINWSQAILTQHRQIKIQQDKLQIQSKKLTTKQSQIKTNKKSQIPKIITVSLSHSCSISFSQPLLSASFILSLPWS